MNQSLASLVSAHVATSGGSAVANGAASTAAQRAGGFAAKLHALLTDIEEGKESDKIACWAPHGRAFIIRDRKSFISDIMPKYFYQLKYNSFQRQLNLYGFKKIQNQGQDKGSFYHEFFLRGMPDLANLITRGKGSKGDTGRPKANEPEPNFYAMEPLPTSSKRSNKENKKFSSPSFASRESILQQASDSMRQQTTKSREASVASGKPNGVVATNPSASTALDSLPGLALSLNQQRMSSSPSFSQLSYTVSTGLLDSLRRNRQDQKVKARGGHEQSDAAQSPHVVDATSALEPTPIREPQCVAPRTIDHTTAFAAFRAAGIDLEPTPLRPGAVVSCTPTTHSSLLLQEVLSVNDHNTKPLSGQNADSDDESCGSDLSRLLFDSLGS